MHRSVHLILGFISILLGVGTLASTATTKWQATTPADVDQWMARYKATADQYAKVFLNLVAEETKVIETFDIISVSNGWGRIRLAAAKS